MDRRRSDHVSAIGPNIQPWAQKTREVGNEVNYRRIHKVEVEASTACEYRWHIGQPAVFGLQGPQRFIAAVAGIDVERDHPGLRACADADVRLWPLLLPQSVDDRDVD